MPAAGPPRTPDHSALCTSCGLCCDGTIFDKVDVEPGETARLAGLGLEIVPDQKGKPTFLQRCTALNGQMCSIYAERPSSCRGFECKLLNALDAGEVASAEAHRRVAFALTQKKALLESTRSTDMASARRKIDCGMRAGEGRSRYVNAMFDLIAIEQALDDWFREDRKRRMVPEKTPRRD